MDPNAGQMAFPFAETENKGKRHFWSSCASSACQGPARLNLDNPWHDFVLIARASFCSFRWYLDKQHDLASILASELRRAE